MSQPPPFPPRDWLDALERSRAACPAGPFTVELVREDDDCWRWQVVEEGSGRLLTAAEERAVAAFTASVLNYWTLIADALAQQVRALEDLAALRRGETIVREVPGSAPP